MLFTSVLQKFSYEFGTDRVDVKPFDIYDILTGYSEPLSFQSTESIEGYATFLTVDVDSVILCCDHLPENSPFTEIKLLLKYEPDKSIEKTMNVNAFGCIDDVSFFKNICIGTVEDFNINLVFPRRPRFASEFSAFHFYDYVFLPALFEYAKIASPSWINHLGVCSAQYNLLPGRKRLNIELEDFRMILGCVELLSQGYEGYEGATLCLWKRGMKKSFKNETAANEYMEWLFRLKGTGNLYIDIGHEVSLHHKDKSSIVFYDMSQLGKFSPYSLRKLHINKLPMLFSSMSGGIGGFTIKPGNILRRNSVNENHWAYKFLGNANKCIGYPLYKELFYSPYCKVPFSDIAIEHLVHYNDEVISSLKGSVKNSQDKAYRQLTQQYDKICRIIFADYSSKIHRSFRVRVRETNHKP